MSPFSPSKICISSTTTNAGGAKIIRNGFVCIFFLFLSSWWISNVSAQDEIQPQDPCAHERSPDMGASVSIAEKQQVYVENIAMNKSHRYYFNTKNETLMHQPDQYRRLIINLEPCRGVVYLFVRKTRRCFPNPYSCMKFSGGANSQAILAHPNDCQWTHYMSVIDGTRDGAPTFFELPLTSTTYYITVYAKETHHTL